MEEFWFGLEFFRYPGPAFEELKKDLDRFAEDGISLIRVQTNWAYEEPVKNRYDFHRITELLDYASDLGLKVIITVCLENAPTWLFRQYEPYPVNARGEKVRHSLPYPVPGDGKPGPCFDNPDAAGAAQRYTQALVSTLARWQCVTGWSVWQEARTMGGIPLQEGETLCWCAHTQAAFRRWLIEKYKDLGTINTVLRTNYADPEDIPAPYLLYKNMKQNPLYFAYADFLTQRLARIAAWKTAMIRRYDPQNRPVMQHTVQGMVETGIGGQWADEYELAKETDIFGASIYPKWGNGRFDRDEDAEAVMLAMDTVRCAAGGRPVLASELQMGRPGSLLERSVTPTKQDIINWTLLCLARGAKGVIGWSYRDESFCLESYGHGVLDAKGRPHDWYLAVPKLAGFLNRHAGLLAMLEPAQAEAAVIVNRSNYFLGHAADREDLPVQSARNIYFTLARRGVQTDFLRTKQLNAQCLSRYKTIFLPFPLVLDPQTVSLLKDYVFHGGHLISECCAGTYDTSSCAAPDNAENVLQTLFGCVQEGVYETADPAVTAELVPCLDGLPIQAVHFVETYQCTDAEPLYLCGGKTAGCRRHFGSGQADLIGTFFGAASENETAAAFLAGAEDEKDLLSFMLLEPENSGTDMRRSAWIFYNRSRKKRLIKLAEGRTVIDSIGGTVLHQGEERFLELNGKSAACLLCNEREQIT